MASPLQGGKAPRLIKLQWWWQSQNVKGIHSEGFETVAHLREKFASGELNETCLVWASGMDQWEQIKTAASGDLLTFLKAEKASTGSVYSPSDLPTRRPAEVAISNVKSSASKDEDDEDTGFTLGKASLEVIYLFLLVNNNYHKEKILSFLL